MGAKVGLPPEGFPGQPPPRSLGEARRRAGAVQDGGQHAVLTVRLPHGQLWESLAARSESPASHRDR